MDCCCFTPSSVGSPYLFVSLCTMNTRYILFSIGLVCTLSLSAQNPYLSNVEAMLQDAESRNGGSIALSLVRMSDKRKVFDYNARKSFTPASVVKTLSTGAVLRERGRRYRFPTEIYTIGKIQQDTLIGSLLVHGNGDPSIGSKLIYAEGSRFANELLQALSERGIRNITGGIYLDASMPTEVGTIPSWAKEDLERSYGAGLWGLNYGDNAQGDRADKDPASTLAGVLSTRLSLSGISVGNPPVVSTEGYEIEGSLLHTYYSKPLDTLSLITNHRSMNMFAEGIGQALNPKLDRGIALTKYWQKLIGVGNDELYLVDGSGLSRQNRLSSHALALALTKLFGGETPEDGYLVESLPRLGREGTLSNFMPETELKAYLKSGTMRQVSTYAGYIQYGDDWYAIAYMTNGLASARIARGVLSAVLEEVFPTGFTHIQ